ncbi:hypothetical protein BU24DRAFT_116968 [Aaosphaeria arxii CBS 175.79]|uniref:Uncharacterized protein n=1 Tax=Aaosphaeria arxii CBS 175.79 TaxID=1450172 RepID=A0A6A5Y1G1_9PLEO|nr:uncharacterized protein BU24DRAFT_116968 [Aaosphaeria arxii CBS 175.79]KAF2019312.1 hypothetical protein BU24DRAFT_116968 [Aaosphaeria arxii CBS 175.79]
MTGFCNPQCFTATYYRPGTFLPICRQGSRSKLGSNHVFVRLDAVPFSLWDSSRGSGLAFEVYSTWQLDRVSFALHTQRTSLCFRGCRFSTWMLFHR